jgi:hypothetical protein
VANPLRVAVSPRVTVVGAQAELFDNALFPFIREKVRAHMAAQCGPRETWMKPGVPIVACLSGGKDSTADTA